MFPAKGDAESAIRPPQGSDGKPVAEGVSGVPGRVAEGPSDGGAEFDEVARSLDSSAPPGRPQHPLHPEVVLDFEPSRHGAACRVTRHRLEGGGGHGKHVVQADRTLQCGPLAGPAPGGDAEGEFRGHPGAGDEAVRLS